MSVTKTSPTRRSALTLAVALSLGPAVALGLARFAYALLLPAMRADLGWSYAQAGGMNTANALGYLGGALLTTPLAARLGNRRAFWASMVLIAFSLFGSGLTDHYGLLLSLRVVSGFGGAVTFISGAALAARLAGEVAGGSLIIGLYFGGVGLGVAATGVGLPLLLGRSPEAWPSAWLIIGALSFVAVFIGGRAALALPELAKRPPGSKERSFRKALLPSLAAYFLFGLGYITYMTFVVAFLRDGGTGAAQVSFFWLVLGASTFLSAFVWGRLLERARGGRALALLLLIVAVGAALPLVSSSLLGLFTSAVLFGGTFLSVVSAVTTLVRRTSPQHAWTSSVALFTVLFSLGQTLGPLLSGALADASGGLTSGFLLSAVLLLVGSGVALFQRESASTHPN